MKIVQIIPSLASGGAERITVDISNTQNEHNNKVFLIQIFKANNLNNFYLNQISSNVQFVNINGKPGKIFELMILIRLFKLLMSFKPDVVHTHINLIYSLILKICFPSVKFFHTLHNVANKECLIIKGISLKKVIRLYYKYELIKPITISLESLKSYNDFYGLSNSELIPNGCNVATPTPKFNKVKDEIYSLSLDKKGIVFINIGRFSTQKNHSMLINVFNRLIKEGESLILLIIGSGFDSDEGQKLVNNSSNGIHFLGTRENVTDYLLNSDAFCLTSIWEGMPISLLEALAAGCTPICTPAGGIPNVIANEKLGFISTDFSEIEYYNIVKNYINNRDKIKKSDLINFFNQNFNIKITVSKLEKIYLK
jgi:glycosyltransferase involved in cell wall biosynthesis